MMMRLFIRSALLMVLAFCSGIILAETDTVSLLGMNARITEDGHLLIEFQLTGRATPTEPVIYPSPNGRVHHYHFDLPGVHDQIEDGSPHRVKLADLLSTQGLLPVRTVFTSQFRYTPLTTRIYLELAGSVKPQMSVAERTITLSVPLLEDKPQASDETLPDKLVITGLSVEPLPDYTRVRVHSNGYLTLSQIRESDSDPVTGFVTITFDLAGAELRTQDSYSSDVGILREITMAQRESGVRVSAKLASTTRTDLRSTPDALQIDFQSPPLEKRVSIRSSDEELGNILLMLFNQYGANIITAKGVDASQKVTLNLQDVPLRVALGEILAALGYRFRETEGGIIVIEPEPEEKPTQKPAQEKAPTGSKAVRTYHLKHAPVGKAAQVLQQLLSGDAKIVEDERTGAIMVIDSQEKLDAISDVLDSVIETLDVEIASEKTAQLPEPQKMGHEIVRLDYADPEEIKSIFKPLEKSGVTIESVSKTQEVSSSQRGADLGKAVSRGGYLIITGPQDEIERVKEEIISLDKPTPQIEIEAYIIETVLSDDSETGFDWDMVQSVHNVEVSTSGFGKEKSGGTFRLKSGSLPADQFLAVLRALSNSSNTEILSNPRITVLEGQRAKFHSGDQVGFSEVHIQDGIQTVQTQFMDLGIVLYVTAEAKSENLISLLANIQISSLGETTATGMPTISSREAQTQVLVRDGDTVVIGGLSSNTIVTSKNKIPILGDIPIIGRAFSWDRDNKRKTDVTIFITPRRVN